ncbi:MAG: hypothetical protein UX08_C0004G0046 [Candidatus Collierbacteria bacterium GW2011_GWB1_45_35]|uniref:Uncharacterized protein n=2 Tax=Candidatus Collieribacteriota TaxID=1752725 RepID=A0A0G1NPC4_9BACT|nr:MAG: hypothetical protein UW48_C0002G0053 [Microgenomates group bacterium GW2011_GWC1_44_23]KKT86059.1 MAG: hypothetical protein UW84_C0017G0026 [Candidatus Collierbacteria bacterium GW2011_GWA2_44_99]KKT95617.1 MAG: hypothetical protein UW96_C0006G0048 [Candidatus Collierbacteria bacterium GW2011_GWA1_45_15]KKU00483.1 MAG: hypothetical protein UX01_C0004G0050 [Candidatus Collierbacteria bacterium GW2011_GWB2_45_17]KKU05583.1 MAG: hypothetical protein UX08_C0004G0046 [Candidatus Collierbacte
MVVEDEFKHGETTEFVVARGSRSLEEVNGRLGYKYGKKNGSLKSVASEMFRDINKFMAVEERDWGADVLAETGLPGTKVVIGGVTVYFHGISHSQGNAIDKGVGKEEFDIYLKEWVNDTYFDKKEGVVLESGFRQAYHMNQGEPAGEDTVMDNLFRESIGSLLINTGVAIVISGFSAMIRRNNIESGVIPDFLKKVIDGRKSIKDLVDLRKSFFKLPQPFWTLLLAELAPTHAVEKSIVMYRLGMDRVKGENTIHFLCGLDHEQHMAKLAKEEGLSRVGMTMFTKKGLELEGKQLLEKMVADS